MANLYYSDSRDIVENDPAIGFDQNNNTVWLIHTYFVSEPLVKKKAPGAKKWRARPLYLINASPFLLSSRFPPFCASTSILSQFC